MVEVCKSLGRKDISLAHKVVQQDYEVQEMLERWIRSTLIPLYKNKGDIQNCANYKMVKFMSHIM